MRKKGLGLGNQPNRLWHGRSGDHTRSNAHVRITAITSPLSPAGLTHSPSGFVNSVSLPTLLSVRRCVSHIPLFGSSASCHSASLYKLQAPKHLGVTGSNVVRMFNCRPTFFPLPQYTDIRAAYSVASRWWNIIPFDLFFRRAGNNAF